MTLEAGSSRTYCPPEWRLPSGGFRTIIVFRVGSRAFFVHGFAKSEQDNIRDDELTAFKMLAARLLAFDEAALAQAMAAGWRWRRSAMSKQYRSRAMASVHETAEGLHKAGLLDKQTMREFDAACLTPVRPLTPAQIRALREREGPAKRCLPAIST